MHKRVLNNYGQAVVIGYALTLMICSIILASSILIMNSSLNDRNQIAGGMQAATLGNNVASIITEAATLKQKIPTASYERKLELPNRLAESLDYYIDVNNTMVWVNTTDNEIVKYTSTFNSIKEGLLTEISGTSLSGTGFVYVYTEVVDPIKNEYRIIISQNPKGK